MVGQGCVSSVSDGWSEAGKAQGLVLFEELNVEFTILDDVVGGLGSSFVCLGVGGAGDRDGGGKDRCCMDNS